MSEIIIPERLTVRLSHDKTWDSCVTKLKENIEPLLAKDPDFFPDYTIHGIAHINRCLDIADRLIDFDTLSEEPKKTDLLTPRDVAFLVCGIMLHDMGMFLRSDGVRKLVQMDRTDDAFGGKPWKDEWSDYVDRTKRLSQEKMRYLFGKVIPVTEDCVNHTDTDDNKRIIGEFLRQHHARLAHELATDVLNGIVDMNLFENTSLKEKDRKLIGILARSHGMAIRDTESYVEKHIGKGAKPYNTPIFYLMTVLRTADALDADERRAPEKLERQKKPHVPISVEEWTWNQCIDHNACDWRMEHKNRYIEAAPESSPQYVQLDKWLKRVQADLDLCWSILAEKYPYDRYRLSIHRVVSNIHEPGIRETMNEKFLTKEAKITANPEIVKLMMEPLYGNDPTYGVRELLQNAVDACLERKNWEEKHGNSNYKGLVDIRIENGTFTITDNGMGMNEDVLLNYYLSAGASYRSSEAWMAANAPDGKSRVARTGKFGVGFLASFLLGDEVEVRTKHIADKKGYHFTFDQKSRPLDIQRADRINPYAAEANDPTHAGTTITIMLGEKAFWQLYSYRDWLDWYAYDDPTVRFFINGYEPLRTGISLSRNPEMNVSWIHLPSNRYRDFQWNPNPFSVASLYCNGIKIREGFPRTLEFEGLCVPFPSVALKDPNGYLDVDLARKHILEVPEKKAFYEQVFRWHIARLLLIPGNTQESCLRTLSAGFRFDPLWETPFLLSGRGFAPNYVSILTAMNIRQLVILYALTNYEDAWTASCNFLSPNTPRSITTHQSTSLTPQSFAWNTLTDRNSDTIHHRRSRYYILCECDALWLQEKTFHSISAYPWKEHGLHHIQTSDGVCILQKSNIPVEMPIDRKCFDADTFPVAIRVTPDHSDNDFEAYGAPDSLFVQTLRNVLTPAEGYVRNDYWIPFDMEERKKKFPKAFEELKVYMDHIRKYPVE